MAEGIGRVGQGLTGGVEALWGRGDLPLLGARVPLRRDTVALVSVRSIWNQEPGFSRAGRARSAA